MVEDDSGPGIAADVDAISFGTDGWRATLEEFTEPRVRAVAGAVADHLRAAGRRGTVAVGYDARKSSPGFADAIGAVLVARGFDALVADRDCPTPALAWTVADRDLAGGLMITASHNPPEYNGVKFVPAGGAPALPGTTDDIEARLGAPVDGDGDGDGDRDSDSDGRGREATFIRAYGRHVLEFAGLLDGGLEGRTVAYDAIHGSGRGVTDDLLATAGADVVRLRCDRDPTFGGTGPAPEAGNLSALVDRVRDGPADVGLANDGDADRIGAVTPDRGCLDPNLLYAVLYDYLLESATGSAVRTVSTTFLVDRLAEAHDERAYETPVGFKWVAQRMAEHDALLGGEESGGFGIRGHLRNKDGVLVAVLLAAADAAVPIDERADAIEAEFGAIHQDRISLDCPEPRKGPALDALADGIPEAVAGVEVRTVNRTDGFKILLADGSWLLVRPSGTEPAVRIYAEADSDDRVAELLDAGRALVEPAIAG